MMRRPALLCALLLLAAGLQAAAKNVVILVLDGPRYSETWGDPQRALIPNLAKVLAPQAAVHASFWNQGPTYTSSGHTAMCTGFYEDLENTKGSELPTHPGIFQYFLKKTSLPAEKSWVITTKDKLFILSDTRDPKWKGRHRPSVWSGKDGKGQGSGYGEDADTVAAVKRLLSAHHPRLTLINLKHPDSGGHSGDWKKYTQGLQASDAYAAEIWAFLQSDPAYKGDTDLLITHDHGRHLDGVKEGFKEHGCRCDGCKRLMLWALGPDFKAGSEASKPAELIDIPVTVGKILGFEVPGAKGRVLEELMAQAKVPAGAR